MHKFLRLITAVTIISASPTALLHAQDALVQPIPGASAPSDIIAGAPGTTTGEGTPMPKRPKVTAADRKKASEAKKAERLAKRVERAKKREEAKAKRLSRMSKFNGQSSSSTSNSGSSGSSSGNNNPFDFGSSSSGTK